MIDQRSPNVGVVNHRVINDNKMIVCILVF